MIPLDTILVGGTRLERSFSRRIARARYDERKVEIERVNDEILKIMQASVEGEFGFYKESVTSKLAIGPRGSRYGRQCGILDVY